MKGTNQGDSVFDEPHMRARPREGEADEQELFAVWDEPALSAHLPPERRPHSFRHWWQARADRLPGLVRLAALLFIALVSGPVAVVTTIVEMITRAQLLLIGIVGLVFAAPTVEEIAKTVVLAFALEAKPYLFRSRLEVVLCAAVSALCFATIENFVYLNVYIPDPSTAVVFWRWIVCTSMHVVATSLTGWGLALEWRNAWDQGRRPEPGRAFRWLVAAIAVHGLYNALAFAGETLMHVSLD